MAMAMAKKQPSVIINADAMQLYRNAPILTAQPTAEEQADVPHQLYGIVNADDVCNVARWVAMVVPLIRSAWQAGQIPLLVGGTGLYFHALMHGIAPVPEINADIRATVRAMTSAALHSALCAEDATMAVRLQPHDTQRLARALEVIRSTGRSLLWWQEQPCHAALPDAKIEVNVATLPREELYARINERYAMMVQQGGLEEARRLLEAGYDAGLPLMRAVGIRQLFPYLQGEVTLEDAILAGQTASRHYAKRQLTWIRHHLC